MLLLLAVIYLVFISLGLPDSLFGVVWPVVHTEFSVPESFASAYSLITGICTGGVSFVAGRLIRRFGTAKVTLVSIFLTAAGLLGISFSPNIAVMMLFSVVLGYGAGAIDTGLNNYISLHYRSHHMNWLHCFWGIGVSVSPLIMSRFLTGETGSWRSGYRVIAAMQIAIALVVLISLPLWKKADAPVSPEEENRRGEKTMKQLLLSRGVPASILSLGLYCSMEFLIGTWGASYLVNTAAMAPDAAAKWVSLYFGGIMAGRFISGFASMRLSDRNMVRIGVGVAFCGMVLLALPLGTASCFGLLLIGIGFGPIFPSIIHSVPQVFGKRYSADITGYHTGGAYAVGFAVQLLFGYMAAAVTFSIMPYVLIALAIALFLTAELVYCRAEPIA